MSLANQMEKNSDATSTFTAANGAQNEKEICEGKSCI